MKHHTLPAILVLLASGLLLLAIVQSFGRAGRANTALAEARAAVEISRRELGEAQRAAAVARESGVQSDRFLATWSPELESESNIEQVFGRLDTLAVNNLLSPSGKNFTVNSNYFFNGRHTPVQNVNITVAGDFNRTLNWLGAAESAFPLARVEQISFTANGNSLALAVQFVFPRQFDTE